MRDHREALRVYGERIDTLLLNLRSMKKKAEGWRDCIKERCGWVEIHRYFFIVDWFWYPEGTPIEVPPANVPGSVEPFVRDDFETFETD